jgi:hypothetical protein
MPVGVALHVLGEAVQYAAHHHLRPCGLDVLAEYGGIIRLGEYGLCYVMANLALVYVEGCNHMNVGGLVTSNLPVHEADCVFIFIPVVIYPLDKRACAISNTDDSDIDSAHKSLLRHQWILL